MIGGIHYTPKMLQNAIDELKSQLEDTNAPFGIDLALPQIGGNARKTNVRPGCQSWRIREGGLYIISSMTTRTGNFQN